LSIIFKVRRSTAATTKQPIADRSCLAYRSLRNTFICYTGMLLALDCDNHILTPNNVTGFMSSVDHYTTNSILTHTGY
jgi:hypothetical protein